MQRSLFKNLKAIKFLIILAIISIGFVVVIYFKTTAETFEPIKQEEPAWKVDAITLTLGAYSPYQKLYGTINTERIIKLLAPGTAEVKKVTVSSGQIVRKGQLLIEIDSRDFIAEKDRSVSKFRQTKLDLKQIENHIKTHSKLLEYEEQLLNIDKKQLRRTQTLAAQKNVSSATLEKTQETYLNRQASFVNQQKLLQDAVTRKKQLQARVKSEKSELTKATLNLQNAVQTAPESGLITRVNVQKGSRVGVNAITLEMLPLDNLEITALLIDKQLPQLLKSLQSKEKITVQVDALGRFLPANLVRLKGESNSFGQIGVFKFENIILDDLHRLRPNTILPISLQLPMVKDAAIVPFSALYGSSKIYAIKKGRMHAINVQFLGSVPSPNKNEDWALIKSEQLKGGETISITHLPNATNNLRVIAQ